MSHHLNPDQVEALAAAHYDDDAYEQQLFALLVDVAWAYERRIVARMPEPTTDPQVAAARPVTLADASGYTPRDMLLSGLRENLDMYDEQGPPA